MRRYDCKADCFLPEEPLPESDVLILEGSYSNLPPIREQADVRIFVNISREEQKAHLQAREYPESLKRFYDRWIPLEEAYFAAYGLPDADCIIINGNAPVQI
jgi:uridine kinase